MKTVLNIKIDKSLKLEAQSVAQQFGIPLGTILNAFLRQFVRNKELSLNISHQPSAYLEEVIKQSEIDFVNGDISGPFTDKGLIDHLKKL